MRRVVALVVAPIVIVAVGCSVGTAKPATYVTDTSATLNAEVSSNQAGEVLYWFEWGTTTEYGNVTPDRALSFPEGHTSDDPPVLVSEPIAGLEPETTYHYRACSSPGAAEGSRGCTNVDQTFTTGPAGGFSGIAFASDRVSEPFFSMNVFTMNADGTNPLPLTLNPANDLQPTWSPNARRIAFRSDRDGMPEVYVMDATLGASETNLTNNPASDSEPAWSPDGTKIAFTSGRDGNNEVYVMDADGSDPVNLTNNAGDDSEAAWSPDGSQIAFTRDAQVYVMDADGSDPVNLTNSTDFETDPAWSPDRRQIAFMSTRDGNQEVYVMDADGNNPTRLTNFATSDRDPTWSPDGTKIAFSRGSEVYAMDADGSNPTNLTNSQGGNLFPDWSPRP